VAEAGRKGVYVLARAHLNDRIAKLEAENRRFRAAATSDRAMEVALEVIAAGIDDPRGYAARSLEAIRQRRS